MLGPKMLRLLARPFCQLDGAIWRQGPRSIKVLQGFQVRKDSGGAMDCRARNTCLPRQIGSTQAAIGSDWSSSDKPGKGCAQRGFGLGAYGLHLGPVSTRGAISLRIRSRS